MGSLVKPPMEGEQRTILAVSILARGLHKRYTGVWPAGYERIVLARDERVDREFVVVVSRVVVLE